jgi:hypothetical protein
MSKRLNSYAMRAEQQAEEYRQAMRQQDIFRNELLERIAISLEAIVSRLNE